MNRSRRLAMAWSAAAPPAGCAGFRGGWESVAYIGDTPPADAKGAGGPIALPGVTLRVTINNRLRTRDTQVMLYIVPTSIDPRDAYSQAPVPGRTRVHLDTTPQVSGWTFRPTAATLSFGGARYAADEGHEFAQWGADRQRVDRGGRYDHQPVAGERQLVDVGRRYLLSVDFPSSVPDPQSRDIVLDVARCLVAPAQPTLPPIRFAPARWEEGYT